MTPTPAALRYAAKPDNVEAMPLTRDNIEDVIRWLQSHDVIVRRRNNDHTLILDLNGVLVGPDNLIIVHLDHNRRPTTRRAEAMSEHQFHLLYDLAAVHANGRVYTDGGSDDH